MPLPNATATATSAPPADPSPTPSPTPQPTACAETQGKTLQLEMDSKFLTDGLRYSIYLPPCYDADPGRTYPVLYLFHGMTSDDTQWVRIGAPATADRLISSGAVPPFIIVMPYDKLSAQPTGDLFEQAVTEELIPYVQEVFHACPERACRAAGGLSRGAGWAIHFGLNRPDLFSEIGGHSPAIFEDDGPSLNRKLAAVPPDLMPAWFLDVGQNDQLLSAASSFEQTLADMDIPHEWRLYNGTHNEAYWSKHVEEYLRWYAQGWANQQ